MTLKNLFLIGAMIAFSFHVHSQNIKSLKKNAQEYFEAEEYYDALKLYIQLDSLAPNNALTKFRIGQCYINSQSKSKALSYFERARELNSNEKQLNFYLGRSYHLKHRFEDAIEYYSAYKEKMKDSATVIEQMNRYIAMCEVGKEMIADSSKLVIEDMGPEINSPYPDYVPAISADETVMIFTSRRSNTTGGKQDPADGFYYEDIYISYKTPEGWGAPQNMGEGINTKLHDACIGLSPDGQKLFIYRAHPGKSSSGDIYVSNLQGNKWSTPSRMSNAINSDSWEPSASITADEKTIYFSSNKIGGQGGLDLYYSKLQENGQWGEAVNMGPNVNTQYDDDAPYIHPDSKTLYFSSRGHRNMGGFDIFSTVFDEEKNEWSAPVNAGYPINTADDDIFFIWSADGSKGYFSSWRDNTYGDKDLYIIHGPQKGTSNLAVLKGKVLNLENKQPIGATITLRDSDTKKTVGVYNSNSLTAKYVIVLPHGKHYEIMVEATGFISNTESFNVEKHSPFFELQKNIFLQPIIIDNSTITLNSFKVDTLVKDKSPTMILKNIVFDHDKATLKEGSFSELQKVYVFLTENEKLKIEISGHTDNVGNDVYNKELSIARAKSVEAYMISKGINKSRLITKSYGAANPVMSNDTEEGRQMNRRIELKILNQ